MKRTLGLCAGSCLFGCLTTAVLTRALPLPSTVRLENAKVKVTEVTYPPATPRERFTRPTDQIVVFLDECRYRRTDSQSGAQAVQERKSGDVIWHNKGDDAPVLENLGTKPYRTLVIELK